VGTVDCDYSVRRSNLAAAAFRADARSQSVEIIPRRRAGAKRVRARGGII
jgi:hypothetical protein